MHKDVHCNFIHNPKLTLKSINRRMDKEIVVYSYN